MKLDATKMKATFSSFLKGGGYRLGKNPSADWFLPLAGFFVLISLVVFLSTAYGPAAPALSASDSSTEFSSLISQKVLDRVTSYYEGKRELFDSLRKNPATLIDPSR